MDSPAHEKAAIDVGRAHRETTTLQAGSSSFLLERGRAGQFEVGMSADEVYRAAGEARVRLVATFPEGMFQPVLQIEVPGLATKPALTAPIREWPCGDFAVWGLTSRSSRSA